MGHMKLFNITQNDIETYVEFDLNFQFINKCTHNFSDYTVTGLIIIINVGRECEKYISFEKFEDIKGVIRRTRLCNG